MLGDTFRGSTALLTTPTRRSYLKLVSNQNNADTNSFNVSRNTTPIKKENRMPLENLTRDPNRKRDQKENDMKEKSRNSFAGRQHPVILGKNSRDTMTPSKSEKMFERIQQVWPPLTYEN